MINNYINVLDVGCGGDKIKDAVGIDILPLQGVDIVHDLNAIPWPIKDGIFDQVVCKHALSHLSEIVSVMEEIHRITKTGGIIEVIAPHYASDNYNTDPTHRSHFGYRSMDYFCSGLALSEYGYSKVRFDLEVRSISMRTAATSFDRKRRFNPWKLMGIEWLINRMPRIYERFFVYWFPPSEVYYRLRVVR